MLVRENKEVIKSSLDKVIVTTANGKPIKPKTLGQKSYVNMIENNDVVFGIGPAGTGKTYLAVAMAIRAFKNNEVNRILLQDLPLKRERVWDFCQENCKIKLIHI